MQKFRHLVPLLMFVAGGILVYHLDVLDETESIVIGIAVAAGIIAYYEAYRRLVSLPEWLDGLLHREIQSGRMLLYGLLTVSVLFIYRDQIVLGRVSGESVQALRENAELRDRAVTFEVQRDAARDEALWLQRHCSRLADLVASRDALLLGREQPLWNPPDVRHAVRRHNRHRLEPRQQSARPQG